MPEDKAWPSPSDPVHYVAEPTKNEVDGTIDEPGWYFWLETWCDRYGPYDSADDARAACVDYCRVVLGS